MRLTLFELLNGIVVLTVEGVLNVFAAKPRRIGPNVFLFGSPVSARGLMLLHTAFGLTAHERHIARKLAKAGYQVALVRYSRRPLAAGQGGALDRIRTDMDTAYDALGGSTKDCRVALIGFSLGARYSLDLALRRNVKGLIIYYGLYPEDISKLGAVAAPILILQGSRDDPAFTSSAQAAAESARPGLLSLEVAIFEGAPHQFDLFKSRGTDAKAAWLRTLSFLERIFEA